MPSGDSRAERLSTAARLAWRAGRLAAAVDDVAKEQVQHSLQYAYRDRRNKKREIRRLWITRINAGARINGVSYSVFMNGLKKANIALDRKVLSDMAITDPAAFAKLVDVAKQAV